MKANVLKCLIAFVIGATCGLTMGDVPVLWAKGCVNKKCSRVCIETATKVVWSSNAAGYWIWQGYAYDKAQAKFLCTTYDADGDKKGLSKSVGWVYHFQHGVPQCVPDGINPRRHPQTYGEPYGELLASKRVNRFVLNCVDTEPKAGG